MEIVNQPIKRAIGKPRLIGKMTVEAGVCVTVLSPENILIASAN